MVKELGYTIIIYVTNSAHRPCVIVLAKTTKGAFTPNVKLVLSENFGGILLDGTQC
jgi:hypothetical protein